MSDGGTKKPRSRLPNDVELASGNTSEAIFLSPPPYPDTENELVWFHTSRNRPRFPVKLGQNDVCKRPWVAIETGIPFIYYCTLSVDTKKASLRRADHNLGKISHLRKTQRYLP